MKKAPKKPMKKVPKNRLTKVDQVIKSQHSLSQKLNDLIVGFDVLKKHLNEIQETTNSFKEISLFNPRHDIHQIFFLLPKDFTCTIEFRYGGEFRILVHDSRFKKTSAQTYNPWQQNVPLSKLVKKGIDHVFELEQPITIQPITNERNTESINWKNKLKAIMKGKF